MIYLYILNINTKSDINPTRILLGRCDLLKLAQGLLWLQPFAIRSSSLPWHGPCWPLLALAAARAFNIASTSLLVNHLLHSPRDIAARRGPHLQLGAFARRLTFTFVPSTLLATPAVCLHLTGASTLWNRGGGGAHA